MIVTDLEYHIETRLVKKLDIMIQRCVNSKIRKDALLIIEGGEGEGKTNSSEAIGYYAKFKMQREMHMFFRLEQLIAFAKNNENKIIIWDEPALDSLSTDWYSKNNIDLTRLLMTCRKKRHFFIFNFVKFYKFSEYINVDRALGQIHMYSREKKNKVDPGRFFYIRKKNLERLFVDYKQKKKRSYKACKSFGGKFPLIEHLLPKMGMTIEGIPNCDLDMYEKLKDIAIESLGRTKPINNKLAKKLVSLKKSIGQLKFPIKNQEELANQLEITPRTLYNWANQPEMGEQSS